MKILLVLAMLVSLVSPAYAGSSTSVIYEGTANESYTITVPDSLSPGETGTVSVTGQFPSSKSITVTAPPTVEMSSNLDSSVRTLDITFPGIVLNGSNTHTVSASENISISEMSNVIFGTWSGIFYYNVSTDGVVDSTPGPDEGEDSPDFGDSQATVVYNESDLDPSIDYVDTTIDSDTLDLLGYQGTTGEDYAVPAAFYVEDPGVATMSLDHYDPEQTSGTWYKITGIADDTFANLSNLGSVSVPTTVTYIGDNAFKDVPSVSYAGTAPGAPWGAKKVNDTVYVEESYVITWDANQGTGGTTTSQLYNSPITLPSSTPVREGYSFLGWYTALSGGTPVTSDTVYTTKGPSTYYARWSEGAYTITWDANGGTPTNTSSQSYGKEITLPSTEPTRAGHSFAGWYTSPTGGTEVTSSTIYSNQSDSVYYANWTLNTYNIRYVLNGGYNAENAVESYTYGNQVVLPTPTNPGHDFLGWYLDEDFSGSSLAQLPATYVGDVVLYAKWSSTEYTITWNVDGELSTTTQSYGTTLNLPSDPSKVGHTFQGWYTNSEGGTRVTSSTEVSDNVMYYAQWSVNSYTITWNNEGSTATTTQNYNEGIILEDAPSKEGHTFKGWYTAPTGGSEVTSSDKVAADVTYYAQWEVATYTVTWNVDGATSTSQQTYNTRITLKDEPSKTGYTFAGWYTAEQGGTIVTADTVYATAGPSTFYAQWAANVSTLVVDPNGGTWDGHTTSQTFSGKYGETKMIPAPTCAGYTFSGWTKSGTSGSISSETWTFGATNGATTTLTAQWTVGTYTVTWDANGGSGGSTTSQKYNSSLVLPTSNPTRTGYTFKGWYTAKTGGTKVTASTVYSAAGATTYYAQWTANTYTINWNSNGGSSVDSTSITYGGTVTLPAAPTKTGHTFAGWFTSASGGSQISSSTKFTGTSDVTYYAHWDVNSYQVSWNYNGGDQTDTLATQAYGSSLVLPTTPTKTGHTFKGWYTAASGGSQVTSSTKVTKDVTYYAQYTVNSYTITWNTNGGAEANSNTSQAYGTKLTLAATPTRTGYTFKGWYTATSGGTKVTSSTTFSKTADTTYYAQWTANTYTFTWDTQGGTPETLTTSQVMDTKIVLPTTTPTKTGHTFKGWYNATSGGTKITASSNFISGQDKTFYAQWTANTYTVTWNTNGGAEDNSTTSQTYNTKLTLPSSTPTRAGYTFKGWYTAKTGGTKVTSSTTYTTAGTKTYYAQWTANTYTFTYDANGGTPATQTTSVVMDGTAVLPDTEPTRTGYTFKGWYTATSGGTKVTNSTSFNSAADRTLYAQWTANTYTITWDSNGGADANSTSTIAYGSKLVLPDYTPTREGYVFKGWYNAASGGKQLTSSTTYNVAGNFTCYAQWTQVMSSLKVGSVVIMQVDGASHQFVVVQQGRPSTVYDASTAGTWLMSLNGWQKSVRTHQTYASSNIPDLLNNTFHSLLPESVQGAIKTVLLPSTATNGSGTSNTHVSARVFLLTQREVLGSGTDNGVQLTGFKNLPSSLLGNFTFENATGIPWWTRSCVTTNAIAIKGNTYMSVAASQAASVSYVLRPVFIVDSNTPITSIGGVSKVLTS